MNIFEKKRKKYLPKEIPNVLTIPVTIWYKIAGPEAGQLGVYSFDYYGDKDTIILDKQELQLYVELKQDIQKLAIDSLKDSIKDLQAETWKKVQDMQSRIEKLQMLTYQPRGESEDAVAEENRQARDSVLGPDDEMSF